MQEDRIIIKFKEFKHIPNVLFCIDREYRDLYTSENEIITSVTRVPNSEDFSEDGHSFRFYRGANGQLYKVFNSGFAYEEA